MIKPCLKRRCNAPEERLGRIGEFNLPRLTMYNGTEVSQLYAGINGNGMKPKADAKDTFFVFIQVYDLPHEVVFGGNVGARRKDHLVEPA